MKVKTHNNKLLGGVIVTLALLPGCWITDMFQSKAKEGVMQREESAAVPAVAMTGDIIVTMNGKPIITSTILEAEKENIFKSNPQIKAAIAFMDPKVLDRNLIEGLVSQAVVDKFIEDAQLNKSSEYKAELKDAYKAIERMLNAKYFSQKFKVSVSDSELKNFYEENKDKIPGLLVSQGGIAATGIQFDTDAAAKAFMAKVSSPTLVNFKNAAQESGLTAKIKDFKVVSNQSIGMEPALRDKIVAIKTAPSIQLISADKAHWVVFAASKEDAKYRPFEQVKDGIMQELEKNKRGELFEKEINRLKKEYSVIINEDYFKGAEMPEEAGTKETADTSENTSGSENRLA
jgi:hypothetical protein